MSPPSSSLLLSTPASQLDVAAGINSDIELKFDWEDFDILSGERPLIEVLDEANVDPYRVTSVHLPPGVRTRGREIGMAATEANVGSIVDFVHDQLTELPEAFLVMHPPREFDYSKQLNLLSRLCDLTGREITIENPPDESYWYTPEDIAFFAFVGATYPDWSDMYVTIDSKHLPAQRSPTDPIDQDPVADLFERLDDVAGLDVDALRKAFRGHLTGNVTEYGPPDVDQLPDNSWSPLLTALILTADRVKSVHFNDPVADGVPELECHGEQPILDGIREIIHTEDIFLVLEPDRTMFDRPVELSRRVDSVEDWLAGRL